jgi:hypothetical protein
MIENIKELIDDIVSEVAFRTDSGLVDFRKREHIYILSEVLTEMGLGGVKDELISALMEADEEGKFKNPILNKRIDYEGGDGEKRSGLVGNLLRLKDDEPGRIAAEKLVPEKGTPERDELNTELGSEGQPTGDTDAESGDVGTQTVKEPETGTALKDPAYQNRVKNEKEIQARLDAELDGDSGKSEVENIRRNELKISDKKMETAINNANTHIDSITADSDIKEVLRGGVSKLLKGEEIDSSELDIIKKWISIRIGGGDDIGLYIANTEGVFNDKSRKSVKIDIVGVDGIDEKADKWNETVADKYGLSMTTQTGAWVNKKDFTAAKMNKSSRRKVEFTNLDGKLIIDGIEYESRSIPDESSLVQSFLKKGISEDVAVSDARKIIASIERRNIMIGKLSKLGDMEIVDYGKTDTDENRKITLNSAIKSTRESILKSIQKFSNLSTEDIQSKYEDMLNAMDDIETLAPINNPNWESMESDGRESASKEYLDKLLQFMESVRNDENLSPGGPDLAEVVVFMNEIGNGNQAFLPSSSNFPTVDIVSFSKQSKPPDNLTSDELAEFYANEFMSNSISFIDSDADSIKVGKGGASAGHKKSTESNFGNEKTKEVLDTLMDCYTGTFGGYPPSTDSINKGEESYKLARVHLINVLMGKGYTPQQSEKMVSLKEQKSLEHYEQAKKAYQSSIKGEELDPEFDRGLKLYNMAGNMFEMLYNRDLVSNNFGNTRFMESSVRGKVKIKLEVLDGINEKCCVKFNPNPGELKIKGDGNRRTSGINVSFSTWITNCSK